MTDKNNKTETETRADAAPYIKKDDKSASHTGSEKQNSSTPWLILLIAAALIPLTIYKFNEERSAPPVHADVHADVQETTVDADPALTEALQEIPANDNADMQLAGTNEQPMPPAEQSTPLQSNANTLTEARTDTRTEAQEQMSKNREMMLQRRQEFEQELQKKRQEFKAIIEAHQKERDIYIKQRKEEFERIKQNRMETREKVQEIQKQIFELHEKIRQLMLESHPQTRP